MKMKMKTEKNKVLSLGLMKLEQGFVFLPNILIMIYFKFKSIGVEAVLALLRRWRRK